MIAGRPGMLNALLAGLLLAGVVHIVAVLAIPHLGSSSVWHRYVDAAAPHRVVMLSGAEATTVLPFHDPYAAIAACGYDLSTGPVRVRVPVGIVLASLSAHTTDGRSFYAMTDRAARDGAIEFVLMTRGQLDEAIRNDDEDEPSGDVRVLAPDTRGIAVVRAIARMEGEMADAQAAVRRLVCTPEREE